MSRKTKKLVAILTNHDDDIYCFRKEVIEKLVQEQYDVLICCPYGPKMNIMDDIDFKFEDIKIDRRGTNAFYDLMLFFKYLKIFKKYKPDVVLTYTIKPNVYGSIAAQMLKIPYVNNITGLGSVTTKSGLLKKIVIMLFKLAFRKSNCIFFQNEENMKLIKNKGLIKNDYMLIPGSGVNIERFQLQEYPKDSEKVIFNYIGRVLRDKGIDDYIEAAKKIRSKYDNVEFNIIGFIEPTEIHYKDTLEKLQQDGIVLYRGSQNDVRPFISRAHAIIHPSIYGEGMSNVLLENAASGRPIITTNNIGCKETVEDGVTGFIYEGGNLESLIEVIEKFLALKNEERKKMGLLGREKMCKYFSRSIVVDQYINVVNKATN